MNTLEKEKSSPWIKAIILIFFIVAIGFFFGIGISIALWVVNIFMDIF